MTDDGWTPVGSAMWKMAEKFSSASCIVAGTMPISERWRKLLVESQDGNHLPAPAAEGD